jgi:hypothetical protein
MPKALPKLYINRAQPVSPGLAAEYSVSNWVPHTEILLRRLA